MKKAAYIIILFLCCSFILQSNYFLKPEGWPEPVYNFSKNPLTTEKVKLGKMLFYDPILSENNMISCESCHSPFSAFTHIDHSLSHGIYDSVGTRNSPALMNLAWQKSFMWDGAINSLDMQALAPISHPSEMGSNINDVVNKLNHSTKYKSLFFDAYGDSVATGEHTLKAISQFLLTLVSSDSKYDRVMAGKDTFTEKERNGYNLFRQNCNSCHQEPLFTKNEFANNGLQTDESLNDIGRMQITGNVADSLKFKIPTLRNIEFTYPYMHDGRFNKLSDVLNHYTNEIQHSSTLADELKNEILLSSNEKVDIINFLLTLSDRGFIFNKNHRYTNDEFSSR